MALPNEHVSVPTKHLTPTWWDNLSHEVALIWLWVAVPALIAAVVGAIYWEQRKVRAVLAAGQYYCHRCRRGTSWSEDKSKCLECPAEPVI